MLGITKKSVIPYNIDNLKKVINQNDRPELVGNPENWNWATASKRLWKWPWQRWGNGKRW